MCYDPPLNKGSFFLRPAASNWAFRYATSESETKEKPHLLIGHPISVHGQEGLVY